MAYCELVKLQHIHYSVQIELQCNNHQMKNLSSLFLTQNQPLKQSILMEGTPTCIFETMFIQLKIAVKFLLIFKRKLLVVPLNKNQIIIIQHPMSFKIICSSFLEYFGLWWYLSNSNQIYVLPSHCHQLHTVKPVQFQHELGEKFVGIDRVSDYTV